MPLDICSISGHLAVFGRLLLSEWSMEASPSMEAREGKGAVKRVAEWDCDPRCTKMGSQVCVGGWLVVFCCCLDWYTLQLHPVHLRRIVGLLAALRLVPTVYWSSLGFGLLLLPPAHLPKTPASVYMYVSAAAGSSVCASTDDALNGDKIHRIDKL